MGNNFMAASENDHGPGLFDLFMVVHQGETNGTTQNLTVAYRGHMPSSSGTFFDDKAVGYAGVCFDREPDNAHSGSSVQAFEDWTSNHIRFSPVPKKSNVISKGPLQGRIPVSIDTRQDMPLF